MKSFKIQNDIIGVGVLIKTTICRKQLLCLIWLDAFEGHLWLGVMSPYYSMLIWIVCTGTHTHTHVYPTVSAQPWVCSCWTLVCPQALVIAGISLQTANLYGYIHCKLGGQKAISRVTSRLFGTTDVPKSEYWGSAHGVEQPTCLSGLVLPFPGSQFLQWVQDNSDSPPSLSGSVTWKSHNPRSLCSMSGSLLSFTAELLPSSRRMFLS